MIPITYNIGFDTEQFLHNAFDGFDGFPLMLHTKPQKGEYVMSSCGKVRLIITEVMHTENGLELTLSQEK